MIIASSEFTRMQREEGHKIPAETDESDDVHHCDTTHTDPPHESTQLIETSVPLRAPTSSPSRPPLSSPATAGAQSAFFGLLLVILSSAAFASMNLLVSQSSRLGVPSFQSASVRFFAQTTLSVAWITHAKQGKLALLDTWLGKSNNRRLLIQRGVLGAVAMCCLFYTVSTLPLAEATCIAFLNVPFTTIIAACTLGERYTLADGIAGIASTIGVVLVVQPPAIFGGRLDLPLLSLCIGLLYAVLSSCVFVTIRAIGPHESALVLVLYFGATGCIVAPSLLGIFQSPSLGADIGAVAGLQIGVGLLGFVGQVFVNRGMQLAPAGPSSAMRYSELVFALVFQVAVQGEQVGTLTLVGALLVMSGVGAVLWKARLKARRDASNTVPGSSVAVIPPIAAPTTATAAVSEPDAIGAETSALIDSSKHDKSHAVLDAAASFISSDQSSISAGQSRVAVSEMQSSLSSAANSSVECVKQSQRDGLDTVDSQTPVVQSWGRSVREFFVSLSSST